MEVVMQQTLKQGFEERNLTMASEADKVAQFWHKRLENECPGQTTANKESIVRWLLGSNQERFEDPKQLDIAKQAMEYRWKILNQRYLGKSREAAY
ncbi:hypothetical protein CBP16_13645, partial [Fischerella thermalis WC217]